MTDVKGKAGHTAIAERRNRAVQMRNARHTWQEISDALGYSSSGAACKDVSRALDIAKAALNETAEVHRAQALERLDAMYAAAWRVLSMYHVKINNGDVIRLTDETTGETVFLEDTAPVLAAIDRLVKIEERRARLLGTDQPVRIEGKGDFRVTIEGVDLGSMQ